MNPKELLKIQHDIANEFKHDELNPVRTFLFQNSSLEWGLYIDISPHCYFGYSEVKKQCIEKYPFLIVIETDKQYRELEALQEEIYQETELTHLMKFKF